MSLPPNRIVAYATAILGLVAALAPVVADLDWTSTAGVIAGIGVIAATAITWLNGWQKYEERTAIADLVDISDAEAAAQSEGSGEGPLDPGPEKAPPLRPVV